MNNLIYQTIITISQYTIHYFKLPQNIINYQTIKDIKKKRVNRYF